MPLLLTRNVVIPVSFVAFAMALFLAPVVNVAFALFLLAMGLALSTMVDVLWREPPVAVALVAPSLDIDRRESTGNR
jgi:hypothetical protein